MSWVGRLFGIDSRSLIAFRIGLGLLLLADLVYRALDFRAHYTDAGVLPRALYLDLFSGVEVTWSLHLVLGSPAYTALLFGVAGVAALALLRGSHAHAAAIVSWVLLVSLHNRQPLVVTGSDMILRLLLFWSLFLPLAGAPRAGRTPRVVLSPASAALLLQVVLIYAFSVAHKLADPAWVQLEAVGEAMRVEGVATDLGRELLAFPTLLRVATASTLALELALPLLAFAPWATARIRIGVVIAMWAFHLLGIGGTMNLGLFEYVMAVAWLPFLPPLFWDRVAPGWHPSSGSADEPASRSRTNVASGLIVAAALCLVLLDNVASLDRARFRSAAWTALRVPTRALALSQDWRLWSTPLRNRYYVFRACLEDGSEVDLHTGEALDWDRPRRASSNNHWWKYQLHVSRKARRRLRPAYGAFLIREWNREHEPSRHVAALELVEIDARHPRQRVSSLPREILWRGGPRPSACGSGTAGTLEGASAGRSSLPAVASGSVDRVLPVSRESRAARSESSPMSPLEMVPSASIDAVEYWRAFLSGRPGITRRDPGRRAREFSELPAEERARYHAFRIAGKVVGTVRLGHWDLTEDPHAITFFSMTPEAREWAVEAIGLACETLQKRGAENIVAGLESGDLETFARAGFQEAFSRMAMRADLRRLPTTDPGFLQPQERDAAEIAGFFRQVYEGHPDQRHGMHVGPLADWLAYATALVADRLPSCSWLARDSTGIAGVCLVTLATAGPFINELGVRKDVRGAGLGKALASASINSLLDAGHSELRLDVTVGNDSAISLYESLGFRETGERLVGAVLRS